MDRIITLPGGTGVLLKDEPLPATITEILALWDAERSAGLPPHERIKALSRASQNERASR